LVIKFTFYFGNKIYVLKPLFIKQIPKFRSVWGETILKRDKKSEEIVKKEEIRKERNRKERSRKERGK
jgi:hypothetical protein